MATTCSPTRSLDESPSVATAILLRVLAESVLSDTLMTAMSLVELTPHSCALYTSSSTKPTESVDAPYTTW